MVKTSFVSTKGFSLIEVLIALTILVIVILGVGLYFFYGRLGIHREGYRRIALELASQRLEELKASDWPPVASGETVTTVYNLPGGSMITNAQYNDYLTITVTVKWHDNLSNEVQLTTLIAP